MAPVARLSDGRVVPQRACLALFLTGRTMGVGPGGWVKLIVDSPRPFRESISLVGRYILAGYSMACGMHSNVA